MKYITIKDMSKLLGGLRSMMPQRSVSFGDALTLASNQAFQVRAWLVSDDLPVNLAWLLNQRAIPVTRVPRYRLGEHTSGLTTDEIDGRLRVFINQNEPHVRQRFTLAHEFKHVIDFELSDILYSRLGSGVAKRHDDQVEAICNHFAACLLMPTAQFKREWFRTQDVKLLAELFHVSPEAVTTRLDKLGLRDLPAQDGRTYFRRSVLLTSDPSRLLPAALAA